MINKPNQAQTNSIEIHLYRMLSPDVQKEIEQITFEQFGNIDVVKAIKWSKPGWSFRKYEGNKLVSFCNLIERVVLIDNQQFLAAGINNMITPEAHRSKGFASEVLRECQRFTFEELGFDLGLLLCADELIPFYEKHGWYVVSCPVYFKQGDTEQVWSASTMLISQTKIEPRRINLNGLPW